MRSLLCFVLFAILLILSLNCKKVEYNIPNVVTSNVSYIASNAAIVGGSVIDDGGTPIIQRGVCWDTSENPTIEDEFVIEGGRLGPFKSTITNLKPNTLFYLRAFATNKIGTSYGEQSSFTTLLGLPLVETKNVSLITFNSAVCGGDILDDGGSAVTLRGVCWSNLPFPKNSEGHTNDGIGNGSFISNLKELQYNTTYYIRAYAQNEAGIAYGNQILFKTAPGIPAVSTYAVTSITATSANCGGCILDDRGAEALSKGICWGTSQNPTVLDNKTSDGSGNQCYKSMLSGLTSGTTYYLRAYAQNVSGTGYGAVVSFTAYDDIILFNSDILYGSVTDVDNNTYKTVNIGSQMWMAENLATTRYNNGDPIQDGSLNWRNLSTGAYVWYCNDQDLREHSSYGALYNNYAATDNRNICPLGWHVPTKDEFTILVNYLGGHEIAGTKLKESGTRHWNAPNQGATNESGFTAISVGYIWFNGQWGTNGESSHHWSKTPSSDISNAYQMALDKDYPFASVGNEWKKFGFSVRCIKD